MIDISIIIPTYNRLWCLPEAIESCRGSVYKTEIIVIDDGSTDGTYEWLKSQSDLIVLRQQNMGKCWAVNKGFEIARGKYIRFLDSDDLIEKMANDEQFKLAEEKQADLVVSGYRLFNETGIIRNQNWIESDDFIAQQLGECDGSHYSAYLLKKEFITDIPHRPDFALRDDRLFVLEIALKYPKVAVHKGIALLHRVHQSTRLQFTSGVLHIVQNYQHLQLYIKILAELKRRNELTERRINAAIRVLWPLTTWVARYNLQEANNVYTWILELNPGFKIIEKRLPGVLYKIFGFAVTQRILKIGRMIKYGWI